MWAVCIKHRDGGVRLFTPDMAAAEVRTDYEGDVHITPCTADGNFGVHEFIRLCPCHPRIEIRGEFTYVIHTTRTQ